MALPSDYKEVVPLYKAASYTSAQTGTAFITPSSGKRFALSHLTVAAESTTAGRVTVWFGAAGDTSYTEGTDTCVFDATLAPSASTNSVFTIPFDFDVLGAKDYVLRVTTSAAINVRIQAFGYEFK